MKPTNAANDNLFAGTVSLWQSRLGHEPTREDARQIVENVVGFFDILAEWSRAERRAPANDNGKPRATVNIVEARHDR